MPTDSRAQVAELSDAASATLRHRDGVCAAGQAQDSLSLLLEFKLDRPGRFITLRGGVRIGGIDFKEGGWFAFEYRDQRAIYGAIGRCRAHFAACDMWGALAGSIVARMPENRPPEPPQSQPQRNAPRETAHASTN